MHGQNLQDRQVVALLGEMSYRQVAAHLGMSLAGVQRAEKRYRQGSPAEVGSVDPVVSLLTGPEMTRLHITPYDIGVDALTRWRFLGLGADSAAGQAARAMFDHGRGGEVFAQWCWCDDPGSRPGVGQQQVEDEPLPLSVRDERIIELRRDGLTQLEIAEQLSMTQAGVGKAITRLAIDGPRRHARKSDDDGTESEDW